MRSRAELALRVAAFVAIALWLAIVARPRVGRVDSSRVADLETALPRWTTADPVGAVHVRLDTTPSATSAAWLSALRTAGVGLTWQGDIPALAIETYAGADPTGVLFVATTGPSRRTLSDDLGPLDTLVDGDVTLLLPSSAGGVALTSGRQSARVTPAQRSVPRRVLVAGAAGWETKFVIAALEENGWAVDARLALGAGLSVTQGQPAALDTSRYGAVVLMDSESAESMRGVEAFVRAGGGVVLSGDANRARAVAALVAWRATRHEAAPLGTPAGDTAWRGLSRIGLAPVSDSSAIALESRSGALTVAARRHYAGRVAAAGYDQTWRWRMAGAGNSLAAHRAWWSRLVAGVASPVISSSALALERSEGRDLQLGSAPLASLSAALGPQSPAPGAMAAWWTSPVLANLLGAVAFVALVVEWLLRRARGLK